VHLAGWRERANARIPDLDLKSCEIALRVLDRKPCSNFTAARGLRKPAQASDELHFLGLSKKYFLRNVPSAL
jgi:hypothetical protein